MYHNHIKYLVASNTSESICKIAGLVGLSLLKFDAYHFSSLCIENNTKRV